MRTNEVVECSVCGGTGPFASCPGCGRAVCERCSPEGICPSCAADAGWWMEPENEDDDEPTPVYACGECGIAFGGPAFEDELRRWCCPQCGSTNIDEEMPDEEQPDA